MIHDIIYKQFWKYLSVQRMSGLQWFSLSPSYGESYGPILKSYVFLRDPRLLDIGNANIRVAIRDTISPLDESIIALSDPDEQYSGGMANKQYHLLLLKYFGDEYDGTIIDENHLQGNDDYSDEDLRGASEIVIWKNFTSLLRVVKKNSPTPPSRRRKRRSPTIQSRRLKRRTSQDNKA